MTYNTNEIENFALSLPITQTARRIAQQFASGQPTPEKTEQVRLNTLAVCVVNDYLQMIGISTDPSVGDSWNPIVRLCADVADLEVTGVGRLECRPIARHQQTCYVPPEVWSDRIGYVVVQVDESSLEATVLGFARTANTETLPIRQLQPIEDLIDYISQPTQSAAVASSTAVRGTRANLSQWLVNAFETGWQTVETLLNPAEPDLAFSFRSAESLVIADRELENAGTRRAKLVDLAMRLAGCPIALVVEVMPESKEKSIITIQVHPTGNQTYLPPLLQLTVVDEFGLTFLEAQARSADNYIQLQFSGLVGEQFSVKIDLGDASFGEDFVI